jgi:hypothetical protein
MLPMFALGRQRRAGPKSPVLQLKFWAKEPGRVADQ